MVMVADVLIFFVNIGGVTMRICLGGMLQRGMIMYIVWTAGCRCDHKNLSGWYATKRRDHMHCVDSRL